MTEAVHLHQTTTGHAQSDAVWLDSHFSACRTEYEAMLNALDAQPGWHVLAAGTGSGAFLPRLAEQVGPAGRITAMDLAPEHITAIRERQRQAPLTCAVVAEVGGVTRLPYPDGEFHGVWCGAVSQYLSDSELRAMPAEFARVTRPGGRVAIKDFSAGHHEMYPAPLPLIWRLYEALEPVAPQVRGLMRVRWLRRWLEDAGFEPVRQGTWLIERWAPLAVADRAWIGGFLSFMAERALEVDLGECDREAWVTLRDPASPDHPMNQADFYWCEGHVVAVGTRR